MSESRAVSTEHGRPTPAGVLACHVTAVPDGVPAEALVFTTVERRAPRRAREQKWDRRRVWSAPETVVVPDRAGRRLRDPGRGDVPVLLQRVGP